MAAKSRFIIKRTKLLNIFPKVFTFARSIEEATDER